MISRRNYFSILLMMLVVFVMFIFSQIVIDKGSQFDINAYAVGDEDVLLGKNSWQASVSTGSKINFTDENGYVLYFSPETTELEKIILQWCDYTKRNLVKVETLEDFVMPSRRPEIILLDAANLEFGINGKWIVDITEYEIPIVFCNLPDVHNVKYITSLRDILGIREVRALETDIEGVHLFEGFFLGGESLYVAETDKEQKRQDMELNIPWYVMRGGTKTYMVGVKDAELVKREDFPALIWRNTYNNTKVFAVCGDYMSTSAGLGILNTFVYEMSSYEIYPVVNAQNIVIANYPGFADENKDKMLELYSRTPDMVFQDVMWPSIASMSTNGNLRLTCFFNPQYDYKDEREPSGTYVPFYLQQLKQLDSEAGISVKYKDNNLEDVLKKDAAFLQSLKSEYLYTALYAEQKDLQKLLDSVSDVEYLSKVRTIACEGKNNQSLISYATDTITVQCTTGNAKQHTYMDNFTMRSLQTALGYSNVLLDLHPALWPEKAEDEWQFLYDEMSSNVLTYWADSQGFDKTTLTESDKRVRNFLNLNFQDQRADNVITLKVDGVMAQTWFILRTHDEKVVSINGGSVTELEKNAYLIKVTENEVTIELEPLSLEEQGAKTW